MLFGKCYLQHIYLNQTKTIGDELQVGFGTDGIILTALVPWMASMLFYKHHLNLVVCSLTTKAHFL